MAAAVKLTNADSVSVKRKALVLWASPRFPLAASTQPKFPATAWLAIVTSAVPGPKVPKSRPVQRCLHLLRRIQQFGLLQDVAGALLRNAHVSGAH